MNIFTAIYNNCIPVKRIKASKYKFKKPWITRGLLKSILKKIYYIRDMSAIQLLNVNDSIKVTEIH